MTGCQQLKLFMHEGGLIMTKIARKFIGTKSVKEALQHLAL